MMKDKRFVSVYKQGMAGSLRVILDTETGVQYLAMIDGYAGGITPLLDRDGKPLLGQKPLGEE